MSDSIEKVIAEMSTAFEVSKYEGGTIGNVRVEQWRDSLAAIQAQGGGVEAVARVVAIQPLELTATVKMKALLNGAPSLNMGDSLYTTPPAPDVPEGWAVVPVQPTPEMETAGWIDKDDVCPCDIYRAMLAAAPKPQEPTK